MAVNEFSLDGRVFRTKADYQLALRDKKQLEKLKIEYDFPNPQKLEALHQKLKEKKSSFYTMLAKDFTDEVEELLKQPKGKSVGRQGKNINQNGTAESVEFEKLDKVIQKEVKKSFQKKERYRKLRLVGCCAMALACFGYVGYILHNDAKSNQFYSQLVELREDVVNQSSNNAKVEEYVVNLDEVQETVIPEVLDEYKSLYNKNKRLIGWLKIDDTNIDYPVLQTTDNEYYLTHNMNQEYDKNGSIFLDKDCDIINRNTNLIIYGHSMSSGNMFGKLNLYKSEDYYQNHKYISFDTIYEKGTYEVVYAFQTQIYKETEITFKFYQFYDVNSEQEFNSFMNEMKELSLYDTGITPQYGDEFITLATCDYFTNYGRFVVVARRVS